jgi:hypothetical protein
MQKPNTPILDKLLSDGLVWLEGGEYVGRATDGVVVRLGEFGEEEIMEVYFADGFANPETW